jgi:hypothetical protein
MARKKNFLKLESQEVKKWLFVKFKEN